MKIGKVILPNDAECWPHELLTAKALAKTGFDVIFIRKSNVRKQRTADIFYKGMVWEMKAPISNNLKVIERDLRRATRQSLNVVFDMRRMKKLPSFAIERELRRSAKRVKALQHLKVVNRHGEVMHKFKHILDSPNKMK